MNSAGTATVMEIGVDIWNPQPINDLEVITQLCEGTRLHIAIGDLSAHEFRSDFHAGAICVQLLEG